MKSFSVIKMVDQMLSKCLDIYTNTSGNYSYTPIVCVSITAEIVYIYFFLFPQLLFSRKGRYLLPNSYRRMYIYNSSNIYIYIYTSSSVISVIVRNAVDPENDFFLFVCNCYKLLYLPFVICILYIIYSCVNYPSSLVVLFIFCFFSF